MDYPASAHTHTHTHRCFYEAGGKDPVSELEAYREMSPIHYVESVTTPLMMCLGDKGAFE
jgi:dipeptidyl aminopeptidase/acylaminoacyl peptidase